MEPTTPPRHTHSPIVPQPYPWLVICDGKHGQQQFFFDVTKDRYYTASIPEMFDKSIYPCSRGWLVLVDHLNSKDCYLWNPISLEKIQLPLVPESFHCDLCVLSSPPSDPTCHILFFELRKGYFLHCQPGDLELVGQELECGDNSSKVLHGATVVGKTIYIMTTQMRLDENNGLFTVEFTGSKFQFTQLMTFKQPLSSVLSEITNEREFLIDDGCGEEVLFMVRKMCFGFAYEKVREILVFQMDFSEKRWVNLKSIGEQTIFLSGNRGISCSAAKMGVKPNSIYYTRWDDRLLYVYDLENQSISRSLPCPIVSRDSRLDWIMV